MKTANTFKAAVLAIAVASLAGCELNAASRAEAAAPPQFAEPDARYRLDPARKRLWVLTRDGVVLHDLASSARTPIALPELLWAGELHACLPDLALGPKGEVVVTSNVVPTLWRIHPETLAVSVHRLALDADTDKDIGFSGIAWSPEQRAFVALNSPNGSVWRIDAQLTRASKLAVAGPLRGACGVCVHAPQERWDLDFSPDQRSALLRGRPSLRRNFHHYVPAGQPTCDIG